jgi:hypothetical protein
MFTRCLALLLVASSLSCLPIAAAPNVERVNPVKAVAPNAPVTIPCEAPAVAESVERLRRAVVGIGLLVSSSDPTHGFVQTSYRFTGAGGGPILRSRRVYFLISTDAKECVVKPFPQEDRGGFDSYKHVSDLAFFEKEVLDALVAAIKLEFAGPNSGSAVAAQAARLAPGGRILVRNKAGVFYVGRVVTSDYERVWLELDGGTVQVLETADLAEIRAATREPDATRADR